MESIAVEWTQSFIMDGLGKLAAVVIHSQSGGMPRKEAKVMAFNRSEKSRSFHSFPSCSDGR
jgi:hypothetical protein